MDEVCLITMFSHILVDVTDMQHDIYHTFFSPLMFISFHCWGRNHSVFRQVLFSTWRFLLLGCAVENACMFWCTTFSSRWSHTAHMVHLLDGFGNCAYAFNCCTNCQIGNSYWQRGTFDWTFVPLSKSCICQLISDIRQFTLVYLKTWAQLWKVICRKYNLV